MADGSNYEIRFGQRYVITVISDSGVNADLDKVEVLEVVGAFVPKSLPAPPGQPAQNDNTSFFGPFPPMLDSQVLGIIATTPGLGDDIAVTFATKADNATQAGNSGRTLFLRRVTGSLGGTASFDQYFTFKDLSTASGTLVVPKSGFTHSLKVPDPGALPPGGGGYTKATLEVKKSPSAATIAGVTVTAGSAVNGADGVVTIEVTAP